MEWYEFEENDQVDSPALLVYRDRIAANIAAAVALVKKPALLRPHVKTHKMPAVTAMMLAAGITKFKCATIAEAEMLAEGAVLDILLAYQPVGPKQERLLQLTEKYPGCRFACLLDHQDVAKSLSKLFEKNDSSIDVFIDVNNGNDRTGIKPENTISLYKYIKSLTGLRFAGIHVYDGHMRYPNLEERQAKSDAALAPVLEIVNEIETLESTTIEKVIGGSPSFSTHWSRDVQCSPGTFIFWDDGYLDIAKEQPFQPAAIVMTRIISQVDEHTITADLGHKAIAAENPMPRVRFLNHPELQPISQSEEHMVIRVEDSSQYPPGTVLYGIPFHICPTVALYETAQVIENHHLVDEWQVLARRRKISI